MSADTYVESERGFDLSFRTPDSGKLLFEFDAPVYEHVILFAPSAKSEPYS